MAYVFVRNVPTGFAVYEDAQEVMDKVHYHDESDEWMDLRTVEGPMMSVKIEYVDVVVEDKK